MKNKSKIMGLVVVVILTAFVMQGCKRAECWGCYKAYKVFRCKESGQKDTTVTFVGYDWESKYQQYISNSGKSCDSAYFSIVCVECNDPAACVSKEDALYYQSKSGDKCELVRFK